MKIAKKLKIILKLILYFKIFLNNHILWLDAEEEK